MRKSMSVLVITFLVVLYFSAVANAALKQGLIGYWNFDEGQGDVAMYFSGNGNHLMRIDNGGWAAAGDIKIGSSAYHNSGSKEMLSKLESAPQAENIP
jgi:hypothetical protein